MEVNGERDARSEMERTVKAMALSILERGIKTSCERCFYVLDPTCPDFPHICGLEESMKASEGRAWALEYIPEKVEMRENFPLPTR